MKMAGVTWLAVRVQIVKTWPMHPSGLRMVQIAVCVQIVKLWPMDLLGLRFVPWDAQLGKKTLLSLTSPI